MERAIAEMEKIKRAEEIYSRRKNLEDEVKKQPKSIYKVLFEILFLINVIVIIIAVQNQNYIFTEEFIKQVNSYNISIREKVTELFESKNTYKKENLAESISVSGESNNVNGALVENEIFQDEKLQSEEKAEKTDEEEPLSQEEQDIQTIKANYSIILPVFGTKTSGFGERESNNPIVTKFHTGIDISADQGTVINSAISGTVLQVSNAGDYGKHIKIENGDLVTLYAHCSKIYVQEGQFVEQGTEIGEVGSTGNSTGPHLHFEIRLQDRLVNPEKILEF